MISPLRMVRFRSESAGSEEPGYVNETSSNRIPSCMGEGDRNGVIRCLHLRIHIEECKQIAQEELVFIERIHTRKDRLGVPDTQLESHEEHDEIAQ